MTAKKRTKPSFKPTGEERTLVEQMAAVGIPQEGISRVVRDGIDPKTLRKYFRAELDTGGVKANAKVAGALYNKAIKGDTTAAIWWTKARMGWSEKRVVENVGVPNQAPPRPKTFEEWLEQKDKLEKAGYVASPTGAADTRH